MAYQLAKKQYLLSSLKDLEFQKKAFSILLNQLSSHKSLSLETINNPDIFNLLSSNKCTTYPTDLSNQDTKIDVVDKTVAETISSFQSNPNNYIESWANESYEIHSSYPNQLKFKSVSGKILRSKSESFIDQALFMNKIPYRYECKLILNGIVLYPDFTILHPQTGKILYWEHFGMMDDYKYSQKAINKIELYNRAGIIPGIDLIMTFETDYKPFMYINAEEKIKEYFS